MMNSYKSIIIIIITNNSSIAGAKQILQKWKLPVIMRLVNDTDDQRKGVNPQIAGVKHTQIHHSES